MSDHVETCPVCGVAVADCDCEPEIVAEARKRAEAGQPALVDASNPGQTARMAKAKDRREAEGKADMNWLMRHEPGRRLMWALLESCGIFRNAYLTGEGRTEAICFHLGESNIGLSYFRRVMVDEPDGYNLMIKENSGRLSA